MNYAGFWRRFAAVFIDGLLLGVVNSIIITVLNLLMGGDSAANNWNILISLLLTFGYYVYYQNKAGQTLGKKVLGVKVVDAQGKTPSMMTFFLREIIGKFVSTLVLCLGYLWMLWDPKKQTWHDKIASTFVVKV